MTQPYTFFLCTECGRTDRPCRHWEPEENDRRFKWIEGALCEIVSITKDLQRIGWEDKMLLTRVLKLLQAKPTGLEIRQLFPLEKNKMSTPAGGTSVFQEVPTPQGAIFPSGTKFTWSVDDTADITLTPSADGTQVQAACVASPTGTSYNLTCTSDYTPPGAPTPVSATVNVAIIPANPAPTGMTINQLS